MSNLTEKNRNEDELTSFIPFPKNLKNSEERISFIKDSPEHLDFLASTPPLKSKVVFLSNSLGKYICVAKDSLEYLELLTKGFKRALVL